MVIKQLIPKIITTFTKKRIFAFLIYTMFAGFFRISLPKVFCRKGVLINFAKLTGKHLCQSLFFNRVALKISAKFTGKHLCRSLFLNEVAALFYRTNRCRCFCRRSIELCIGTATELRRSLNTAKSVEILYYRMFFCFLHKDFLFKKCNMLNITPNSANNIQHFTVRWNKIKPT